HGLKHFDRYLCRDGSFWSCDEEDLNSTITISSTKRLDALVVRRRNALLPRQSDLLFERRSAYQFRRSQVLLLDGSLHFRQRHACSQAHYLKSAGVCGTSTRYRSYCKRDCEDET